MQNFISRLSLKEREILNNEDNTKVRLQNIAWPSECSADIGPFTVGECKRSLFYKIIGVKPTENMSLKGAYICDAGLMYERYHIERFKTFGMLVDTQYRIQFNTDTQNNVIIVGKIDCIISDDGSKKAIEMKSVSAFKVHGIFGNDCKTPLPSPSNLMQVMLYKHWLKHTDSGKNSGIDEVYLMYINRNDNSTFYFRIDLDEQGYPIITPIDQYGNESDAIYIAKYKSYEDLLNSPTNAEPEEARFAEVRISTTDIFKKFDIVYSSVNAKILPDPDYKIIYSDKDIELNLKCGRITKRKITTMKKAGETRTDYQCTICPYLKRCLSDSGINFSITTS